MKFFCRHCEENVEGKCYRVTSKEGDETLFDMIVCHSCFLQARALGLESHEIGSRRHARRPHFASTVMAEYGSL